MRSIEHSLFPSGRSVANCRKDAKRIARAEGLALAVAQDQVALTNGGTQNWALSVRAIAAQQVKSAPTNGLNTLQAMRVSDVRFVLQRHPDLTHFGYGAHKEAVKKAGGYVEAIRAGQEELIAHLDECNKAVRFLLHVDKRKTINSRVGSSYGLKHEVENFNKHLEIDAPTNYYLSNGAFICAALHLGFEIKRLPDSPNVLFNMSSRSLVFEWRRLSYRSNFYDPARAERLEVVAGLLGVTPPKRYR